MNENQRNMNDQEWVNLSEKPETDFDVLVMQLKEAAPKAVHSVSEDARNAARRKVGRIGSSILKSNGFSALERAMYELDRTYWHILGDEWHLLSDGERIWMK